MIKPKVDDFGAGCFGIMLFGFALIGSLGFLVTKLV